MTNPQYKAGFIATLNAQVACIALMLSLLTGCERLPSTSYRRDSGEFQSDVVDPTWVEKTSWRAQSGGFAIKQPPLFEFLSGQPRLKTLSVGEPNAANAIKDYEKPSWMDEDVYAAFRSYVEPPSTYVQTKQRVVDGKSVKACVVSRDGSRLMLVQDSIIVLDTSGADTEKSFPNPLANCIDAAFDQHSKHAVLYGDNQLVKISLDDGSIVQQTNFPSNEGRLVCFAANSDLIGVATEHGELTVLDEQWKPGPSLAFDAKAFRTSANRKSIAIDANGDAIVAATSQGISAWRLNAEASTNPLRQNTRSTQYLSQDEAAKVQDVVFCADAKFYSIAGPFLSSGTIERVASSGAAALAFTSRQSLNQPSKTVPELVEVCQCHSEKNSWLVIFRQVGGKDGNRMFVHDVFDGEANSEHTTMLLDVSQPRLISMSCDGTKIAVVSEDKLEIWTRKITDATGVFLVRKFGELFDTQRFEQIEKCFAELQRLNVVRGAKSRDDFNQMIAAELAQRYKVVLTGRAITTTTQNFVDDKNDLSIDIRRQLFQGGMLIGGTQNAEPSVSEESLIRSLNEGDPSIAKFRMLLQETPCTLENIPKVSKLLKRCVERFPECNDYHVEVVVWIERIGYATIERYLEDVCALAPEGQEALRMLQIVGKLSSRSQSISTQLADFGDISFDSSLVDGPLPQSALLAAIRDAHRKQDAGLLESLKQRYAEEHPLVPVDLNWQTLTVQPARLVVPTN